MESTRRYLNGCTFSNQTPRLDAVDSRPRIYVRCCALELANTGKHQQVLPGSPALISHYTGTITVSLPLEYRRLMTMKYASDRYPATRTLNVA